ncbi:MAG: FlgD immunoglobulin-like domain containing protein [Ignavibacteriaceae bacterium]
MKGKLFFVKYLLILFSITINAQILNGSFETWSNNFNPDNWITNNAFVYNSITKSTDKYTGEYALKGEVVNYDSSSVPPILFGGTNGQGFTVSKRYASFDGYYKFVPVPGDVLSVVCIMYKDNSPIASFNIELEPSSDYTNFNLPINYSNSEIPDRFFIEIVINDTTGALPAHIGSYYLLDDVELSGESVVSVAGAKLNTPETFYVYQNYPNPFNPSTTIRYSIPGSENVIINIFDIKGNLISTLLNARKNAGTHEISWDGKNNSGMPAVSGVYLYKVQAGSSSKVSKMILLK